MIIKKINIAIIIIFILLMAGLAEGQQYETKSHPNYLIILVHGINGTGWGFRGNGENGSDVTGIPADSRGFGDLLGYLSKDLGLDGYVYYYSFSERDGKLDLEARELADPDHDNAAKFGSKLYQKELIGHENDSDLQSGNPLYPYLGYPTKSNFIEVGDDGKGNSWFEQAKIDFKSEFYKKHGRYPDNDEIPKKYILIAHSLGGAACRSYLSSDYYRGDVEALITLSSQHLGSDGAMALKRISEYYKNADYGSDFGSMMGLTYLALTYGRDDLAAYTAVCATYVLLARAVVDYYACYKFLGWYPTQPAVQDIDSDGAYMRDLNSKQFVNTTEAFKVRTIAAYGIPTPNGKLPSLSRLAIGLEAIETFATANKFASNALASRSVAAFMSFVLGANLSESGDVYSKYESQIGAGIGGLKAKNIDYKYYGYDFGKELNETQAVMSQSLIYLSVIDSLPIPLDPFSRAAIKYGVLVGYIYDKYDVLGNELKNYLLGHGEIIKKAYDEKIIDHALEDYVTVGGTFKSAVIKSGISASVVSLPTASYSAPEQAFVLLSNLDPNGKTASVYHTVTIEAFTEGASNSGIYFPIEVDGAKRWVSSITVKETPTAIKGVIDTFLPKKLKRFNYSENFAAWKPVGEVDEWGNFTIKDLKLAEGQNVIAFDAESWIGNKNNQHLKIILNTIPLLPSQFTPTPNYYISDANPEIAVDFAKSEYTGSYESEKVNIKEMTIDGIKVVPQVQSEMKDYRPWARASYKWTVDSGPSTIFPLTEGEHQVAVRAESNVGVSQGLWSFHVDRSPPTVTIEAIPPYSPRSPTTIKYTASDEVSPNLLSVRCDLYDPNDKFVANIATADAVSKGDNSFSLNPGALGVSLSDGDNKVKIKAFDLAGNFTVAEQPITIDATPPTVTNVKITPDPMTSNSNVLSLEARVTEKSTVIIKLTNLTNSSSTAYITQAAPRPLGEGMGVRVGASYSWNYDQAFTPGPEDGTYKVEVIARDDAGNESAPATLEAITIDRTPPQIFGQSANPYVLANSGGGAYQTTLSYNVTKVKDVKIKVYNANTGANVDTIYPAPASSTAPNSVLWNANGADFPKGAYRFQIIAQDEVGNIGVAYASCVKDGIAPVISFPAEDNTEITGTIAIRGTAVDPDWTNSLPFKDYRVYYKEGQAAWSEGEEKNWETALIEVPQINRDPNGPKNVSLRPLQNNGTLAYLNAAGLKNDTDYTVLVIVDEDGGESLAAKRVIHVNNSELAASAVKLPYIKLNVPGGVDFKPDDSVKMPIGFMNSVKPSNVYIEIYKAGSLEAPVYYKYFPNILGAPFIGKPAYQAGSDLGYFIWSDENGYHLRWSADGSKHKFTGNILLVANSGVSYTDIKTSGSGIKVQSPLISWDSSLSGGEGGIDFKLAAGQIMITAKIDEDPNNPSITADNTYLGVSKYTQAYLPVIIDAASQQLVDVSSMGKTASSPSPYSSSPIGALEWNGRTDTGGYVDNGTYLVRARAEGVDGVGVVTDEATVSVTTPFLFSIKEINNQQFSTLKVPDRVSISYNLSKDALVTANVYDSNGNFKSTIADGEQIIGSSNNDYNLSWRGNYPAADSTQVVTGGQYKIVITAEALDNTARQSKTIDNINVSDTAYQSNAALYLDPIGQTVDLRDGNGTEKINLSAGDSPFYYEAKGFGHYHPPKDFSFTLSATGKQRITGYPYVPFAALMHRGFNEVDTRVKVKYKIHTWNWELGCDDEWHIWPCSGHWWNPWKWGLRHYDQDVEQWVEMDALPNANGARGLIFKAGDDGKNSLEERKIPFDFRTDAWWHQNGIDTSAGKPSPGSGIDSVDVMVELSAKDGSFMLDNTTDWVTGEAGSTPTIKGVFAVTNSGDQYQFSRDDKYYGAFSGNIIVKLEAPIAYSRLTNRFVPWVGFTNAVNPSNEVSNFSGYMDDLNKLGFPGKAYFVGSSSSSEGAPHKGSFNSNLFPGNTAALASSVKGSDGASYSKPNTGAILTETDPKMSGSASDYTSYLSDEYIEFIPITAPYKGYFQYGTKQIESGKLDLTKQSSYPIQAMTSLAYASNETSPFEFSWPWAESELTAVAQAQNAKHAELNNNPSNYSGPTIAGTWWDLDPVEIGQRRLSTNNTAIAAGQVRFKKSDNLSVWDSTREADQILPMPFNYLVLNPAYSVVSNTGGIKVNLTASTGPTAGIHAEDLDKNGEIWTTTDDPSLSPTNGVIRSQFLTFNDQEFKGERTLYLSSGREDLPLGSLSLAYQLKPEGQFPKMLKYTFLKYDPFTQDTNISPVDNPNIEIDSWQVSVKDRTGGVNRDLIADGEVQKNGHRFSDTFKLKLNLDASEARYVEIAGSSPGPYVLSYFDGNNWKQICQSDQPGPTTGHLGWWNVSRLNGRYTVMLQSAGFIATQNVSIGTLVDKDKAGDVYSTYKRAQLSFPPQAFVASGQARDQLVTVTPVSMQEIYIRNRPIIMTSGPIVEVKPSPWQFMTGSSEGAEKRPTLKFVYTFDDLKQLKLWAASKPLPTTGQVPKDQMLPWNIHQVTAAGDLQIVGQNYQEVVNNNGELLYAFSAPLDHFSTYALLPGTFKLSAPIVFADTYITNQPTVGLYGTAEPGSILSAYVFNSPQTEFSGSQPSAAITADGKGKYRFDGIPLPTEGNNYLYVTSSKEGEPGIMTWSDVTIVKDTIAPAASASCNLYAFSPNGDGKYDSVDYLIGSSEKGRLNFGIRGQGTGGGSGNIIDLEISAEAGREVKINWNKNGFDLYQMDNKTGQWTLYSQTPNPFSLPDGSYQWTVYAIDEAGNISNNLSGQTVIDTTPPAVLGLNADPNPFTPNGDGVNDKTNFWLKFSKPVNFSLNIFRDDGRLFRAYSGMTGNFQYPNIAPNGKGQNPSSGTWSWDGCGSRNELIGGTYSYSVVAEDGVGNAVSSEVKTVVVDRAPTLVPYAYAEPDPFAPVNPENSFTEIKFYLARDGLKVNVAILGEGDKPIKLLVNNEIQNKGEHSARWYGDFDSNYSGPTAAGNKYRAGDGSYQFKLYVEDPAGGNPASVTNTVLVDNIPPAILIKDLAVDYKNKLASLTYSIPEVSSVEVSVFDKDGMLLAPLVTNETQNDGDHQVSYQISGEGERYFQITAQDRAKNSAKIRTGIFSTQPDVFRLTNCQAQPATFTPNGDGLMDITRISYNLAGGVTDYRVNLDVQNSTGSTVRSLVVNESQGGGTYSFYWEGKNDAGQLAPDGYYDYVVRAEDKLGAKIESRDRLLMIAARPSISLSSNVSAISPNNSEANSKITINYSVGYSTFYISGEALVKLEVLNSSGEAVWTKIFNKPAGSYLYDYNGLSDSGAPLSAGTYYVRASAEDALGSTAVPQTIPLTVDYSAPVPSDFTVVPVYARSGTKVQIGLNFTEQLAATPAVDLTFSDGTIRALNVASSESGSYECSYVVGDADPEGTVEVSVSASDLAMNPIVRTASFMIDKTAPEVTALSVSPNPAGTPEVSGQVSIKFNVSEPLGEAPKVYVTQNGAPSQLAVTGGQWLVAGGQCEAKYSGIPGYDGTALITIETTDLAGNRSTIQPINCLTIDAIAPIFSNLKCEIGNNPEYSKFAKEGSTVAITFNASEPLKVNPDVRVNNNPAVYDLQLSAGASTEYTYNYTISSFDNDGTAEVTISGYDYAGNNGQKISISSESFVADLTNPTVAIATPETVGEYISNPGNFATNANPDKTDRPLSTTFYYRLAEDSKVTVQVYKVDDGQTTYAKADFNDGNLIATLVDNLWQAGNIQQTITWDGKIQSNISLYDLNNDTYADPGKYAFIVEGRDRASNLTLKKWGGTVWIVNNVLTLKQPDQQDFSNVNIIPAPVGNPDPQYISPNGNSEAGGQKRARFYFMIDLSLNPTTWKNPERIEAQTVAGAYTKIVGKYSVKIYSDSGLTNLIRTVTTEADAPPTALIYEDWDGKNDAGQYVPDGNYYFKVEVKDFAGNPSNPGFLSGEVIIDNTTPEVKNLSAAPYYFSPGATTSTIKSTTLTYEVADNSGRAAANVEVYFDINSNDRIDSSDLLVETLVSQETKASGVYNVTWSPPNIGSAQPSPFKDGKYLLKVFAIDQAGNTAEAGVKEVFVDTQPAYVPAPSAQTPTNNPRPLWAWSSSDANPGSGLAGYYIKVGSTPGGGNKLTETWCGSAETYQPGFDYGEGQYYLSAKAMDKAGNLGSISTSAPINIDLSKPQSAVAVLPTYTASNSFTVSWSGQDYGNPASSIESFDVQYRYRSTGFWNLWSAWTDWQINTKAAQATFNRIGASVVYEFRSRAKDKAGNIEDYPANADAGTTIDVDPPSSYIYSLPAYTNSTSFTVSWGGSDGSFGSGIAGYDVQYRVNNGAWVTWLSGTPLTAFTFQGSGGNIYYFQCRARDNKGNQENYPGGDGDASITIDTAPPVISAPDTSFNPYSNGGITINFTASDQAPSSGFSVSNLSANIKYNSTLISGPLTVNDDGNNNYHVFWDGKNSYADYVNDANYTLEISASDGIGNTAVANATVQLNSNQQLITNDYPQIEAPEILCEGTSMRVTFYDGKYFRELNVKSADQNFARDIINQTFAGPSNNTYSWNYGYEVVQLLGNYYHRLRNVTGKELYYSRSYDKANFTPEVLLYTSPGEGLKINAGPRSCIASKPSGDLYIVWVDQTGSPDKLYFREIPFNFAPFSSNSASRLQTSAITGDLIGGQAPSLKTPILISPEKDKQNVNTIRPAFEWKHHKADASEYKIDVAKNDTFSIGHQTFDKSANTGSVDPADSSLYNFTYAIHEFDPGLDRDIYFWKVTALSTNEAATSEVWSFQIQPDLTLADVTNYPNPFNPNREKTKIRYRLSTDADEVKIRIYDITGSLVNELDGTTIGEGSSVWNKYNDVEWDGRNGRGDMVMNGIYPFEITARLSDKTLTGRGKIAVLK